MTAYDAIVIGGGAAGLSAGLMLGRARRRTLIVDAGRPRNAPSPASHGVFTRDGVPPGELLREARAQLARYPAATVRQALAESARPGSGGFEVTLSDGVVSARRLLLAPGVRDELPAIEGLPALWGTGVLHCPYCHGWEVRDQPLAVYWGDPAAAALLTLVLGLTPDLRDPLARRGVEVVEAPLRRIEATPGGVRLHFADGRAEERRALFLRPPYRLECAPADALGCERTDAGLLQIGPDHQTSVPGVYAAGDAAEPVHQVLIAAASRARAAMMLNRALADADLREPA